MKIFVLLMLLASPAIAGDKAGIIVGDESGTVRRVLMPNNDEDLNKPSLLDPGESMIVVDKKELEKSDPFTIAEKITGKDGHPQPVAVVDDKGNVERLLMADPVLDKLPGKTLVKPMQGIQVGDVFDGRDFQRCDADTCAVIAKP